MTPGGVAGGAGDLPLAGRTIVVTGSAAGIGQETARVLKQRGAVVIGMDQDPTRQHSLQDAGHDAPLDEFVVVDLGESASIDRALERLPEHLDGLCNIAGVPGTAGARRVRDVNYLGLRHLTRRACSRG